MQSVTAVATRRQGLRQLNEMWVNVLANLSQQRSSWAHWSWAVWLSTRDWLSISLILKLPTQPSLTFPGNRCVYAISFTSATWATHLEGALHNFISRTLLWLVNTKYQIRMYLSDCLLLLLKLTPPAVANTNNNNSNNKTTTRQSGGKRKRTLQNQLPTVFYIEHSGSMSHW